MPALGLEKSFLSLGELVRVDFCYHWQLPYNNAFTNEPLEKCKIIFVQVTMNCWAWKVHQHPDMLEFVYNQLPYFISA